MKETSLKMKIIIIAAAVIIIGTIGLYIHNITNDDENYQEIEETSTNQNEEIETENTQEKIMVHIIGEVKNQGVVVLESGARIVDAIEAAGGETDEADLTKLNLANILNDGEKIKVPKKGEEQQEYITSTSGLETSEENKTESQKININTANLEELTKLPGIGEATANKIISYRKETGKFKTIEDLKNVPGIGNSKFDNLKDMITIK